MFLYEALLIGIIGTIVGMICGVILSKILVIVFLSRLHLPIRPIFVPWTFIKVGIMAILLSLTSGLYPAWRASRLDPVVALRYE